MGYIKKIITEEEIFFNVYRIFKNCELHTLCNTKLIIFQELWQIILTSHFESRHVSLNLWQLQWIAHVENLYTAFNLNSATKVFKEMLQAKLLWSCYTKKTYFAMHYFSHSSDAFYIFLESLNVQNEVLK